MSKARAEFGELLRKHREDREITQEYVAYGMRDAGFRWTQKTVSRIESGRRRVTADELWVLAAILWVNLDEVLGRAS